MQRLTCKFCVLALTLAFAAGCGDEAKLPAAAVPGDDRSDVDAVRTADFSVLYVGNSHTSTHDIPGLVDQMLKFAHPEAKVYSYFKSVMFLEEVAKDPSFNEEINNRSWKFVVLQAQKISQSGKVKYSLQEGIDYAKLAKGNGAAVIFFCEWGLKDVEGDGVRQERIYKEMAAAADARVAPIARAWDLALGQRPELPLHSPDGNHESSIGAFLTACVLFAELTGESPAGLAAFPYSDVSEADRKFLADVSVKAFSK